MHELYELSNNIAFSGDYPDYPVEPYYTPVFMVGNYSGIKFLSCGGADGRMVTKIECWYSRTNLVGIRLTYSDGSSSGVFGQARQNYVSLKLSAGEVINSLLLWENEEGTGVGRIEIETSNSQVFSAGRNHVSSHNAYSAPLGSGLLVGVTGLIDTGIDMLGFIFFTEIDLVVLDHVVYTDAPSYGSMDYIKPIAMEAIIFGPANSANEWEFQNDTSRTTFHSFSRPSVMKFFAEIKICAELFDFGYYAEEGWKKAVETELWNEISEKVMLRWNNSGQLKAGQTLLAIANTWVGNLQLAYKGVLTINLRNGESLNYNVQGIYSNMIFSPVFTALMFDPPN